MRRNQNPIAEDARGLLHRRESARHFRLTRTPPSDHLAHLVEHFWYVEWDLSGQPDYLQQNLPHPCVHLSIDSKGLSRITGVISRSFRYRLQGKGAVLGLKFFPGVFYSFYPQPASTLTDQDMAPSDLWGDQVSLWPALATSTPEALVNAIESTLGENIQPLPEAAILAQSLVKHIESTPDLYTLTDLVRDSGLSARRLQRLFKEYIGVSPKWVIDRYRMIAAVEALNASADTHLTELAHRLGYFDQAHFSKAFRALTGINPSQCREYSPTPAAARDNR